MCLPVSIIEQYPNSLWRKIPDTNYWVNNIGVVVTSSKHDVTVKQLSQNSRYKDPVYNLSINGVVHHLTRERIVSIYFGEKPLDLSGIDFQSHEVFVCIPEFNGVYYVSNYGRILSLAYNRPPHILTGRSIINGHPYVGLRLGGKSIFKTPRRLAADAFIDNPELLKYVYSHDGTTTTADIEELYRVGSIDHMKYMGMRNGQKKCCEIRCNETGQVFSSMTAAAQYFKVSFTVISSRTDGHRQFKNSNFKYTFSRTGKSYEPVCTYQPCICNETGVEYKSIAAAARDLGLSEKQVNRAVNKGGSVAGKYTFTKVVSNSD